MRRPTIGVLAGAVLLAAVTWAVWTSLHRPAEIAVKWGEPYEQIRKRYDSILPSPEPSLLPSPAVIARFRFDDPLYGFTTPRAVFYQMGADPETGGFDSVQLSPQVKPLPLNDVIAIVLDIQDQLRRGGWRPFQYSGMHPIEDTPELRRQLHECQFPTSVWNAADKYQVTIDISCRSISVQPGQTYYGVILELGRPFWTDRPGE
ncbi:hypothetical protein AWB75_01010 [Caballeronia catudaia]|uniref:Uncharacterized protein n=1 Tax=Caballeronia catudaia TaxID=1777136 RepID=A0A157ZNG0_9BURK|nr:flagellar biosynthesis sigma factor [Caballeronia catudaia]SAK47021.1 hypothetical protein AWB75_01010 [Caballeronia catudaia]